MNSNTPNIEPNIPTQMPEKKKFPTWIIIFFSVLGGAVLIGMIGYIIFFMNSVIRSGNSADNAGNLPEALTDQNLLDQDAATDDVFDADVFEKGEDAFGTFVRATEDSPKDYSPMFLEDPIVVDWYPHAVAVSETQAEKIYKDIRPQYFLDQEAMQSYADTDVANVYAFHLYELGTISTPEQLQGTPVYIFSYPVGGMGITIWGDYVIYSEKVHSFVALETSEQQRTWAFASEIVDMNTYIRGVISFDTGLLTYPELIDVPSADSTLVHMGSLTERDENPFEHYGAQENAGGILNLTTGNIVIGYPNNAIEFTDKKSNEDIYFVDGAYQVILDDGSVQTYELLPSFLSVPDDAEQKQMYTYGYVAEVDWNADFSQSRNTYIIGGELTTTGCAAGIETHTNIVNEADWFNEQNLTQVGTAKNGDPIYVMTDPEDVQIYKDFFTFGGQGGYMQLHPELEFTDLENVSEEEMYDEFLSNDPIIFWKDHKDRWRVYFKSEYQSLAECGKPVIYLYPEKAMDVNVQVAPNGGFTYTDPVYPESGWFVHATPEGKLYSYRDMASYPYLFWEGHADGFGFSEKGFVFSRDTLESDMTKLLAKAGLNKQETIDFLEFWLPKMQEKPYVFVTFANQHAFESAAPLNITPAPDSVLRVFMNFKSLDTYTKVEPLLLRGFERKGFTVVEWGGILEKK
ncbi:MAG TPA: hypothetical protein DIS59_02660 [Candidatus Magasanikbacteria bacterium]|nr:hypothetical protein [Candidatus Magasanikbacteria bacterium]